MIMFKTIDLGPISVSFLVIMMGACSLQAHEINLQALTLDTVQFYKKQVRQLLLIENIVSELPCSILKVLRGPKESFLNIIDSECPRLIGCLIAKMITIVTKLKNCFIKFLYKDWPISRFYFLQIFFYELGTRMILIIDLPVMFLKKN